MTNSSQKTAVVTGASSGIGAVYADRLAQRGYNLVLVARREDRLQSVAAAIKSKYSVQVDILCADLSTEDGLSTTEQLLKEKSFDLLVNNAGIARLAPLAHGPLSDSLSQIALNITALTRLTQAILPGMKQRNSGTIINIASVMAFSTLPMGAVYSGTKAFVLSFSQVLQQELSETDVKIQVVLPAATATEVWDNSGVPLSALDPSAVMQTENMVDAALQALDNGEAITYPSVADEGMISRLEEARVAVFAAAQTSQVAPRLISQ